MYKRQTILCDINKPVKAASGEAILQNEASLSVSDECYFSKIHKEDRDRIRQAYDDLIAGRTDKVCEEYRVISNESGHWLKCTPNIGRISICLDGMSSVLYRAHVV